MGELDGRSETADDRSEDEAQADSDAHDSHALGPLLLFGDVRGRGAGDGDITGHHARNQAGDHHDPELRREDPKEIRERVAGQGDGQDTTTAQTIRERAPDRREHELQQRVERAKQTAEEHRLLEDRVSSHPFGRRVQRTDQGAGRAFRPDVMVQKMREQRDDDAEAHDVHEHRQEDKSEDAALGEDGGGGHAPHDGVLACLRKQNSGLRKALRGEKMNLCGSSPSLPCS